MRIYTRTGDQGETGLLGGERNPKNSARVEAYGAVDELNAALGWCASSPDLSFLADLLTRLQSHLFSLGTELATPESEERGPTAWGGVEEGWVDELESEIDARDAQLPSLRQFILPGGCEGASRLHLARVACRRAERQVVTLSQAGTVRPVVLRYLNRLSDLLFVLARQANQEAGAAEVVWVSPRRES